MTYKKRCEECGKLFKTERVQTRYCSLECKDIATKRHQKAWKELHPGYHAEKMRQIRAKAHTSNADTQTQDHTS